MKLRKMIACAAAASIAAAMAISTSAAAPYTATIGFADAQWYAQDWESNIEITGDGTYSISTNIPAGVDEETGDPIPVTATGATVFVVDIAELGTDLGLEATDDQPYDMTKCTVSDVKVTAGDTEIAVDNSKILWGDPEGKGNLRIEIYNAYGSTTVDEKYDASVSPINPDDIVDADKITVTFTLSGISGDASTEDETPAESEAPETEAPTTGDSSKPNTNTGAEGIAIAAGVAVLAAGAAVVAKKRK